MILAFVISIYTAASNVSIVETLKPIMKVVSTERLDSYLEWTKTISTCQHSFSAEYYSYASNDLTFNKIEAIGNLKFNQTHTAAEKASRFIALRKEAVESITDLKILLRELPRDLEKLPVTILNKPAKEVSTVQFSCNGNSLVARMLLTNGQSVMNSNITAHLYSNHLHDLISKIKMVVKSTKVLELCATTIREYKHFVCERIFREISFDLFFTFGMSETIERARNLLSEYKAHLDLLEYVFQVIFQSVRQ